MKILLFTPGDSSSGGRKRVTKATFCKLRNPVSTEKLFLTEINSSRNRESSSKKVYNNQFQVPGYVATVVVRDGRINQFYKYPFFKAF